MSEFINARSWQQEDSSNRLVVGISENAWECEITDPDAFKMRLLDYLALCHPGYQVVKIQNPHIFLERADQAAQLI